MTLYDFLNAHYIDMMFIIMCLYMLALGAIWGTIYVADKFVDAYRESWSYDNGDDPPSVGVYGKV